MRESFCSRGLAGVASVIVLIAAGEANATFHLMQIEQVMGGVNGDVTAQAIQLRTRAVSQNFVSASRLRAWDAAGANPVLLINITSDLPGPSPAGDRILIATASFGAKTTPTVTPNYIMAPIPPSYLAAGSLTFEDDFGGILWRLSWGGSGYTGSNLGQLDNDANGNFGPPVNGPLPTQRCFALKFKNAATALSTTNLADYELTTDAAVWHRYHDSTAYPISVCVPTVSQWGLVALLLTIVTAATLLIQRRGAAPAATTI